MVRLILVNGLPASGKSTFARRYIGEHPLALGLDNDVVRGMLGCWLDQPTEAGVIARRMAVEMARVQLATGRDVVLPQFLGRLDFVLELEQLGADCGGMFVEVALLCTPEDAAHRFARRSRGAAAPAHRDAELLLERSGGLAAMPGLQERLLEVISSRPGTITVPTTQRSPGQTYRDVLARLDLH